MNTTIVTSEKTKKEALCLLLPTFGQSSACFHLSINRLRTEGTFLSSVFDHRIVFISTFSSTRCTILSHPGPALLSLFLFSRRSRTLKEILLLSAQSRRNKARGGEVALVTLAKALIFWYTRFVYPLPGPITLTSEVHGAWLKVLEYIAEAGNMEASEKIYR